MPGSLEPMVGPAPARPSIQGDLTFNQEKKFKKGVSHLLALQIVVTGSF